MTEPAKPRRGCLFYGCFGSILALLVALLSAYLAFRYAVTQYTDSQPVPLPKVDLSSDDTRRLQERIADFNQAMREHQSHAPLTVTATEVNALIQTDPNWAFLKDQMYVTFESNRLCAQISFPAEKIGSPRLRGRYLNANGTFTISLRNGMLEVYAEALSAKGRPVPDRLMDRIRSRNFALNFTNADVNAALATLREIQIQDGKLTIVPNR